MAIAAAVVMVINMCQKGCPDNNRDSPGIVEFMHHFSKKE